MTQRDFLTKWLIYGLALLPVWFLEVYVLSRISLFGVSPTLLPLAAITVAVLEGGAPGAGFGLAVGVICDAVYGTNGAMTCSLALLSAGALDVSYLPIQMKKNRPGVLLLCLCRPEEADRLAAEILRHTTTFGVRRTDCSRYALTAASVMEHTAYGPIRRKEGMGYGVTKSKAEYADLARIAQEQKIPLSRVPELLERG